MGHDYDDVQEDLAREKENDFLVMDDYGDRGGPGQVLALDTFGKMRWVNRHPASREPKPQTGHDVFIPMTSPAFKETNPKDAVGVRKVPFSVLPSQVIAEVGLGLLEGGRKYGRHNYRCVGIRASVYYDAQRRHMDKWWEGQDIDPDSGLHHVTKAICSLLVLRDAMLNGKVEDDRPPPVDEKIWAELDKLAGAIIDKYPDAKASFVGAKP